MGIGNVNVPLVTGNTLQTGDVITQNGDLGHQIVVHPW